MPNKDIDKIPITVEVPKADVWLRADYRDIVHRLGEVHMVRACEHQHDDDFVPMYDLQTIAEYQQKAESLRLELDRAWAEVDRCCKQLGDLTTIRKQDELVHGNIMGRIAANLFGRQNNVTDEECVAETAHVGYRQTALIQQIKGLKEELRVWQERYQRILEWASQLKAYEPLQPIIVDADSPMVGVLTGRPCTCHPDDNPPVPCPKKYSLGECRKSALGKEAADEIERLRAEIERLRDRLRDIASVAHDGGLRGVSEYDALVRIRLLTLKHYDGSGCEKQRICRLDAALRGEGER